MPESLKSKKREENYFEMENDISRSSMNTVWDELKNDTWWDMAYRFRNSCRKNRSASVYGAHSSNTRSSCVGRFANRQTADRYVRAERYELLPTSIGNISLRAKGMSPFERCEWLAYRYANSSYRLMREVRIALCESFECLDARGSHRAVPGDLIHLDSAELFERVSICPVRHFWAACRFQATRYTVRRNTSAQCSMHKVWLFSTPSSEKR